MKTFSKKLLSLTLALVFALSLATALPVFADGTVTATVAGTAIESGATIDAVSTVVFTLPNEITTADLATAVKFYEVRKGTATTTDTSKFVVQTADLTWNGIDWSSRLYDGAVSGNTLTVTFSEGDLAANSQYLFVFSAPAVDAAENFVFSTTSADYYYNENFDRYPATASYASSGGEKTFEIQSPWWSFTKIYTRIEPSIEDNNGDKFLRLKSAITTADTYKPRGSIALDNTYAKAYAGSTTNAYYDKYVVESTFSILGNETSIFQVGPIVIRTENGVTGLYYRTTGNLHKNNTAVLDETTSLNYPITKISATATEHTIKYVAASSKNTFGAKKVYQLWFDNQKVTLPDSGLDISLTELIDKNVEYADPVNFYGSAGIGLVLSALQNKANETDPDTVMDVYTYKVSPYVVPPVTVTPSVASGSTISPVSTLTFTFSDAITESTLANGFVFEEEDKREANTWKTRLCTNSYNAQTNTLTVTFAEGALAANTKYRFSFADTITSAEAAVTPVSFEYTTTQYENYYINDNFSRYKAAQYLPNSYTQSYIMPYSMVDWKPSGWSCGLQTVTNDDKKAIQIYNIEADVSDRGYTFQYDTRYAPEVSKGIYEATLEFSFDITGSKYSVFELGDLVLMKDDADGNYYLYVRTASVMKGFDMTASQMQKICAITVPTDTAVAHTLKYDAVIDYNTNGRWIKNIVMDGTPVTTYIVAGESVPFPATGVYSEAEADSGIKGLLNVAGDTTTTNGRIFAVGDKAVTSGTPTAALMNIYSIKLSASGLDFVVTDTTATEKNIKLTNNTGSAITDALVVLAVYNGDQLVGFDGLTGQAVTIANGGNATVTRTVANAAAGNTYKVMVLNSKASLQPLVNVWPGTIQ